MSVPKCLSLSVHQDHSLQSPWGRKNHGTNLSQKSPSLKCKIKRAYFHVDALGYKEFSVIPLELVHLLFLSIDVDLETQPMVSGIERIFF